MLNRERKLRLKQAVYRTCCATGVTRIGEWHRRARGVTLLRLRLLSPAGHDDDGWDEAALERTLGVVSRHYRVMHMDDAVNALKRGGGLPHSAVVLVVSLPARLTKIDLPKLLARMQTPCILYVVPGLLERGLAPWPIMIRSALRKVTADAVEMYGRQWLLTSPEYRRTALAGIIARLYDMPEIDRSARAEELVRSWGVDVHDLPGLKWYEVESMARSDYITVGAAGLTGDSLVRLPLDRAVYEMREARALLQDRINAPMQHFEYPWEEVSSPVREQVIRAGYASALAGTDVRIGINAPGADPFTLVTRTLYPGTQEYIRSNLAGVATFLQPANAERSP